MNHAHVYRKFIGYDAATDTTSAQCDCGSVLHFPSQAKNRSAWSAHGAGKVETPADKTARFVDQHLTNENVE